MRRQRLGDAYNLSKLDGWRESKAFLFGLTDINAVECVKNAVISYLLRELSHGRVPRVGLVSDTLSGKVPVPLCEFVGCGDENPHVH